MSATVEGAVKAVLESLGLARPAFRGRAPKDTPLPYFTVEDVGEAVELTGDYGDPDVPPEVRQEVQVDYWQAEYDPTTGARVEDYATVGAAVRGLRGAVPPNVLGARCYPLRVVGTRRTPSGVDNLRRDTITVQLIRQTGVPTP